jgi:hypothetical protein
MTKYVQISNVLVKKNISWKGKKVPRQSLSRISHVCQKSVESSDRLITINVVSVIDSPLAETRAYRRPDP